MTFFKGLWLNLSCLYLWAHLCPKGTSGLPQPLSLAQESEAMVPKPKGGVSAGGPYLSISQSKEEAIPAEMEF